MCDPAFRREQQVRIKSEAVWVTFMEMRGLLNTAGVAREYFNRSPAWFTQRINGNMVFGKPASFKPEEYQRLSEALRDIAKRLERHADEIDSAAMETGDE